jgi:hypothetical protein
MNSLVISFFVLTTLLSFIAGVGVRHVSISDTARRYGIGMVLTSIAFAIWSITIFLRNSASLDTYITIGLVPLMLGMIFFIWSGASNYDRQKQVLLITLGVVGTIVLMVMRGFYPSNPYFSPEGLFFFGPHPLVLFFEVLFISASVIPSVLNVGRSITDKLSSNIFQVGMFTALIGTILLITSSANLVLFLSGWAIGIAFLLLAVSNTGLLLKKN